MPPGTAVQSDQNRRREEVRLAQAGLLYANTYLSVSVTLIAATALGLLLRDFAPGAMVICWWVYMVLVSAVRCIAARRFRSSTPGIAEARKWSAVFAAGAGLAGAGWGGATVLLYRADSPTNQIFLVFVVGGMMLGAASLLAPRPEAFLAFLLPSGLAPSLRLILQHDQIHLAMGILAAVFTIAVLITTSRIYKTVDSSLRLRFENRDLVETLRAATRETEALNQALELRVQERTAELTQSTERLRAEIAHREKVEEDLLRARKLESLGVLAGGIAHDFNNFLTIVQGNVAMAKGRLDPGEPVQEILNDTATACRRAAFLSSQLLTFAKGGAPVRRLVSIKELIKEAVQLVRAGSSISVHVSIAEDLLFAELDPMQIGQVLHNILLNARQAMRGTGIIELRAENAGCADSPDGDLRIRIAIRDYGCGIPSDIRPRIFDPYFTTKPGSSGLGLATAYSIVAKHAGHILVESTPGVGTVFTVDLPASNEAPPADAPIVPNTQTGTGRLLIMDDEEQLRKLLVSVLTGLGYEVSAARDGAEAIAMYEEERTAEHPFDAVLLDLTVSGGMGGVETAAKLKELDPSCKLIVTSGYSASPVMSDFGRYGFEAVLPKPWSITDIGNVVCKVLSAADREFGSL